MSGNRRESTVAAPALTDGPSFTAAANQALALARAGDVRAGLALVAGDHDATITHAETALARAAADDQLTERARSQIGRAHV